MPDFNNRGERDFSAYDQMTDEQLCQILRSDAKKTGCDETDMELIFHVMEVLAKRREERNELEDPEKALKSFKKNYAPNETIAPVLEDGTCIAPTKRRTRFWRPGIIAAAAALAIVIGGTVTAGAFHMNVFEIVGNWTKETFHFGSGVQTTPTEPSEAVARPYASLQALLTDYDVSLPLVPTWLPEGYEATDTKIKETPKQRFFYATHANGDKMIMIQIKDYMDADPEQIEQSDDLIEAYEAAGVCYYIFDNLGQLRAAWVHENYECYISGPLTIAEMKQVIDSIQRG